MQTPADSLALQTLSLYRLSRSTDSLALQLRCTDSLALQIRRLALQHTPHAEVYAVERAMRRHAEVPVYRSACLQNCKAQTC